MKYELTNTKVMQTPWGEKQVFQICAKKNFTTIQGEKISAGDKGGWIEETDNLSQDGTCWIFPGVVVTGKGKIEHDCFIKNSCRENKRKEKDLVFLDNTAMMHQAYAVLSNAHIKWLAMNKQSCFIGEQIRGKYIHIYDDSGCRIEKNVKRTNGLTFMKHIVLSDGSALRGYGDLMWLHLSDAVLVGSIHAKNLNMFAKTKMENLETEVSAPPLCAVDCELTDGAAVYMKSREEQQKGMQLKLSEVKIKNGLVNGVSRLKQCTVLDRAEVLGASKMKNCSLSGNVFVIGGNFIDYSIKNSQEKYCVIQDNVIMCGDLSLERKEEKK